MFVDFEKKAAALDREHLGFDSVFDTPTDWTYGCKIRLVTFAPMTDVFVAVWKLDTKGKPVEFAYYAQYEDRLWHWDGSCKSSRIRY